MTVIACGDGSDSNDGRTDREALMGIWTGTVDSELGTLHISTYNWSLNYGTITMGGHMGGHIDEHPHNNLYSHSGRLIATVNVSGNTLVFKIQDIVNGMSGNLTFTLNNSGGNAIIISGTPKVGEKLKAVTNGSNYTGTIQWYAIDKINASSWMNWVGNGTEVELGEGTEGKYIVADRINSAGTSSLESNFLGPVQPED